MSVRGCSGGAYLISKSMNQFVLSRRVFKFIAAILVTIHDCDVLEVDSSKQELISFATYPNLVYSALTTLHIDMIPNSYSMRLFVNVFKHWERMAKILNICCRLSLFSCVHFQSNNTLAQFFSNIYNKR